jgi:hypothetical protein
LWNYTKTTYDDSTTTNTTPVIIGVYGDTGAKGDTGTSITAQEVQYYLSSSNTATTGGSWSATQQSYVSGKYYWTRLKITWSTGTITYTDAVLANGLTDANKNAKDAQAAVTTLDTSLNQAEIFNRLTNNGVTQGIYLDSNKIYINAEYIKSGILTAININGGTISLGGSASGTYKNGALKLYNANNQLITTLDKTGINTSAIVIDGTATNAGTTSIKIPFTDNKITVNGTVSTVTGYTLIDQNGLEIKNSQAHALFGKCFLYNKAADGVRILTTKTYPSADSNYETARAHYSGNDIKFYDVSDSQLWVNEIDVGSNGISISRFRGTVSDVDFVISEDPVTTFSLTPTRMRVGLNAYFDSDTYFNGALYPTATTKIYSTGSQLLHFSANTSTSYDMTLGVLYSSSDSSEGWALAPDRINTSAGNGKRLKLGTESHRWIGVYLNDSPNVASDLRAKHDISAIGWAESFVKALRPIQYKYSTDETFRMGFGAQEVREAIENSGHDASTYDIVTWNDDVEAHGEMSYGLKYEEFIAPLTAVVQSLINRVEELERKLS